MTDKTIVLVTGGNSGIGFELASQLLSNGLYHVILGARSADKGEAAVEALQAQTSAATVSSILIDVTDDATIHAAAQQVKQSFGRLDILINNAGRGSHGIQDLRQAMQTAFDTNTIGSAVVCQVFKDLLLASNSPLRKIVNISGGGSISRVLGQKSPDPHYGNTASFQNMPYRASKAALHMVNALQLKEFEPHGIKVLLWTPPFTVSNLGSRNKVEHGAEPVETATKPLVHIVEGGRDHEQGKFLYGFDGVIGW